MTPSSLATVSSPPSASATASGSGVEVVEVEGMAKKDEVTIVVGSRKNSLTKAVR